MAAAVLLLAGLAGFSGLATPAPKHLEVPFEILAPQAGRLAHDPLDFSNETTPAQ